MWQRAAKTLKRSQIVGNRRYDGRAMRAQLRTLLAVSIISSTTLGCGGGGGGGSSWLSLTSRVGTKLRDCGLITSGQYGPSLSDAYPDTEPSAAEFCEVECIVSADCSEVEIAVCSDQPSELEACFEDCAQLAPSFQCGDGEEIPAEWECDTEEDCTDGSDEADCRGFLCGDGEEIPEGFVCDGETDCPGGEDEEGCRAPQAFVCNDGSEVPAYMECDGGEDCVDGSDEAGCAQRTCPS